VDAATIAAEIRAREAKTETLGYAWEAFIAAKAGLSPRTLKEYRWLRQGMEKHFGEQRALASISGAELAEFLSLRGGKGTTRNLLLRYLSAFWQWCDTRRGWCKADTLATLEAVKVAREPISVLSPSQVKTLFTRAEADFPALVPWLALSLFGGLRQDEITHLKPAAITEDGITVSRGKTGSRFIAMNPPLAAWLKAYRKDAAAPIVGVDNFRNEREKLIRACGWKVTPKGMEPPPEDWPAWPQNALRHTAASVALGTGKAVDTLIFEHGHAGGAVTLKKHYLGLMTKKQALEIWTMAPNGSTLPLFAEVKPAKKRKGAA
jgi:site-specific recombinase XerD